MHRDWYEDGTLRMESEMKEGKRHGLTHFWNEEGIKQWIQEFVDGRFVRKHPVF